MPSKVSEKKKTEKLSLNGNVSEVFSNSETDFEAAGNT